MKDRNTNPLFEPISDPYLDLETGLESDDVISGKTSEDLYEDIFGKKKLLPKKRKIKLIIRPRKPK